MRYAFTTIALTNRTLWFPFWTPSYLNKRSRSVVGFSRFAPVLLNRLTEFYEISEPAESTTALSFSPTDALILRMTPWLTCFDKLLNVWSVDRLLRQNWIGLQLTLERTTFSLIRFKLDQASGTVGRARGTKPGRLDSIPGQIMLKTWKTLLAACPTSCSALMGGCKEENHTRCCHFLATSAAFTAKVAVAHGQGLRGVCKRYIVLGPGRMKVC